MAPVSVLLLLLIRGTVLGFAALRHQQLQSVDSPGKVSEAGLILPIEVEELGCGGSGVNLTRGTDPLRASCAVVDAVFVEKILAAFRAANERRSALVEASAIALVQFVFQLGLMTIKQHV